MAIALATLACAATLAAGSSDYVADSVCASCHQAKYNSYQGVGMAQSMRRPRPEVLIEDFRHGHFFHAASNTHFEMQWKDGKLLFSRYQLDDRGRRVNAIEQQVDWIVGSGHRSRVYLYRTPSGELYQLPIAWYTQERAWGMAPGYDRAGNDGITRQVRRECLFCHNAYPKQEAGHDAHWSAQAFPAALPEGTGCQRCHGPGGAHVRAAEGAATDADVRKAIVNPARLAPALRDSVCFQCHLLPAVAMFGVRRFERADYSFRPGEKLADYILHVDIDEKGRSKDDRFEINHHGYRMRQSACYVKGGITCISCHDPHQPLKSDTRLANVAAVCLGCHKEHEQKSQRIAARDCVTCHMPRRRTQDVVRVVMTDHKIQRRPPAGDLLAPLPERDPEITGVQFLDRSEAPAGALGELYRAVTVVRSNPRNKEATTHLAGNIGASSSPVPQFDLISARLQQQEFETALKLLDALGKSVDADARLRNWRGLAHAALGSSSDALDDLRAAAQMEPAIPEYQLNLAAVLRRLGKNDEALPLLTRAIELRPNFVTAFILRAETLDALGRRSDAIADVRRAIAVEPRNKRAIELLSRLQ
jgi:predicted CXXCH cytochrome family protein